MGPRSDAGDYHGPDQIGSLRRAFASTSIAGDHVDSVTTRPQTANMSAFAEVVARRRMQ